jgi:hypothetical protein
MTIRKLTKEEQEFQDYFGDYMDLLRASDAPMGSHEELKQYLKKLEEEQEEE